MRAYKFLDAQSRAPFTLTPWTPGVWVETTAAVPCHEGVHACRSEHLAYWLAATLWEVELDDPVVETRHKLTARRGRLVAPVDGYPLAVDELAVVSTWRARDWAVEALLAEGLPRLAGRLAEATSLEAMHDLAGAVDDSSFAMTAAALAVDTAMFALSGPLTEAPFIGACSAGHVAAGPGASQERFDAGFADERHFQSHWLIERLGLAT